MKKFKMFLKILVIFSFGVLSSCSEGGTSEDRKHCSYEGEVCVGLDIAPSFAAGDPVDLVITVTSAKDFPDLHLVMQFNGEITVDDVVTWEENLRNPTIGNGHAYWNFEMKAGQTLTFKRVLHFPAGQQLYSSVYVEVVNPGRRVRARDNFAVVLTKEGGQVFRVGTPVPHYTPNVTSAVFGPGTPVPTFITNPTNSWRETPIPPSDFDLTPTPSLAPPYPPPSSPSPTPTTHSYP
jgi:hypothetical protein